MKNKSLFLLLCLLLSAGCVTPQGKLFYIAPSQIPFTIREMKSPGFWISRHPQADKIIMSVEEIKDFNQSLSLAHKLNKNIFDAQQLLTANQLREVLEKDLSKIRNGGFYTTSEKIADHKFFDAIEMNINFKEIKDSLVPQYGLIVRYSHQRILPTDDGLNAICGDIDFDELQNSSLDVGTAVVVLHESYDAKWVYIQANLSDGWIRKENVALGLKDDVKNYANPPSFAVVISPRADIYLNKERTAYSDYARMGVVFPILSGLDSDFYAVKIPVRDDQGQLSFQNAYINKEDLSRGYLPYTPRNVINQAFKLLDAPYGWGGMYGEQDCSAFLVEVFASVGIILPRNSSEQKKAGKILAEFDASLSEEQRQKMIESNAIGGVTLLGLKGHIMLYLGTYTDKTYAIHATWAYREPVGKKDRVRVLNRVVVSDLSLGEGSQKGSLLKRLTTLTKISAL